MAETTHISWADSTLNFWIGCTKVSVGKKGACVDCYAEKWGHRFGVEWGNHPRRRTSESTWKRAHAWERKAISSGERPRVFVNSLSDFWDNQVPRQWRRDAFNVMAATPHVTYLLLTKRPQNIPKLWKEIKQPGEAFPSNIWLGCTVVTQDEADRDIPHLLRAKVALQSPVAFLSMEPLMGPVDLTDVANDGDSYWDALRGHEADETIDGVACEKVDWVVAGGESGPNARPSHPDWFRSLRDQCAVAGVPFHFKQWGQWGHAGMRPSGTPGKYAIATAGPHSGFWPAMVVQTNQYPRQFDLFGGATVLESIGKRAAGRLLDGVEHNGFPD